MRFTHYMIFGESKQAMNREEFLKAFEEYAEALKKHNLKMMGPWGCFGVSEGGCFLLEGSVSDFENYIGSDAWRKCPLGKSRTISLLSYAD